MGETRGSTLNREICKNVNRTKETWRDGLGNLWLNDRKEPISSLVVFCLFFGLKGMKSSYQKMLRSFHGCIVCKSYKVEFRDLSFSSCAGHFLDLSKRWRTTDLQEKGSGNSILTLVKLPLWSIA